MDGSPPGSPLPGILQARTPEWVAISFSNAWKWKVKEVKSLICVQLVATPWTAAYQDPLSVGFSRQEYWSGVPKQGVRRWFNVLNKGVYSGLNNPFTMCSLAHEFKLQPPVLSLSFDWISHSGSFSACYTFYPWDAALIPASVLVLDNLSSLKIRYLPTGIDLITVLIVGLLDCL